VAKKLVAFKSGCAILNPPSIRVTTTWTLNKTRRRAAGFIPAVLAPRQR